MPDLLDERFLLLPEVRTGGMAEVQKAIDVQTGRSVAVKRIIPQSNDRLVSESFFREYSALENLKHPNIVEMVACGRSGERDYIVLEWLDLNLEDWLAKEGPINWSIFWPMIGRPLLDAIRTAQAAKWLHRDIKPKNVLMTAAGVPKLSDYGIARDSSRVMNNFTFRDFNSKPYSAPDQDDGSLSAYSRDVFSWAVVAGFCMTGREPIDYGEIEQWLAGCSDAPVDLLRQAASLSKDERPQFAAILLSELDDWVSNSNKIVSAPRAYIQLEGPVLLQVREIIGPEGGDPIAAIRADFLEVQGSRIDTESKGIRLYGANWLLFGTRDERVPGSLHISRARLIGSAEAERQRDAGYHGKIEIRFGKPINDPGAEAALDLLFAETFASEAEREQKRKGDPDRLFRAWHAYLSARLDFETSRSSVLTYTDLRVSGRTVSVTISDPIPLDLIGQDRLIRTRQGRFVALDVIGANGDEITLAVMIGDPNSLPREGRLEVNTVRAEKALERQRQALNAVMHRRSVNPGLRDLIDDPGRAVSPGSAHIPSHAGDDFDPDKIEVLTKALNLSSLLTVEGPPGTGKTRLIEEIMLQYLKLFPKHRVLLSSQTHIGLDNVIDRITKRGAALNIVRVGRLDDQRISVVARDYLLERKAEAWSKTARLKAQEWLEDWAKENGVDRNAVQGGMLALSLASKLLELESIAKSLDALSVPRGNANLAITDEPFEAGPDDPVTRETVSQNYEDLILRQINLFSDEAEIRQKMKALGGLSSDLSDSTDHQDLREFAQLLLGEGRANHRCRELMELQQQWLERIGRSSDFHGAMLASANVVAATCVGLASVRGIEGVAFDLCIVDEASKATATEVLVPLSRSKRAILVGDPKQLPPFFEQELLASSQISDFTKEEITENVFNRLLERLPPECRSDLRYQYRMAKPIGDLISHVFYESKLVSPRINPSISFPQFPKAVSWLDTSGFHDRREVRQGFGFHNPLEARVIRKVLEGLAFVSAARKSAKYSVVVVAGYVAQVKAIENAIMDVRSGWSSLDIKINTADSFQGYEADICIYSVVRSNEEDKVGFLREAPRLNVALSRGRDLLVIVGDHGFCSGLGAELPLASVISYAAAHPNYCDLRPANVS